MERGKREDLRLMMRGERKVKDKPTWIKRDGEWRIHGPASMLREGAEVTVFKRNGTTSRERVERVIWTGKDGDVGVAIATISSASKPSSQSSNSRRNRLTKQCWECGRMFTYAECKKDDGDWIDSYCGC